MSVLSDSARSRIKTISRWVGAGIVSGFVSGLVIGGIGGRLAMFVLRLTSDPSLQGVETDDGFVIGAFSGATGFLIGLAAFGGAAGGIFYVLIRGLLPQRYRAAITALLAALIGGAVIVHPEGIDFKVLNPLWLAIAMFVAIPGLYGGATSKLAEFLGAKTSSRVMPWLGALALPALAPLVGIGSEVPLLFVVLLALVALVIVATRVPAMGRLASSPGAIWAGRAGLAAIALWSGFVLIKDAVAIL